MEISSLLGAGILGSLITLLLKEYFEHNKLLSNRIFKEKIEAYAAYLDVAMKSQAMPDKEAIWARMAVMARVRLCASPIVIESFNALLASSPSAYEKTLDDLIQAMRKDLWG